MDKRYRITDDPLVVTALLGAARCAQRNYSVLELPPTVRDRFKILARSILGATVALQLPNPQLEI